MLRGPTTSLWWVIWLCDRLNCSGCQGELQNYFYMLILVKMHSTVIRISNQGFTKMIVAWYQEQQFQSFFYDSLLQMMHAAKHLFQIS